MTKIPGAILSITLDPEERACQKRVTALHGMLSHIRGRDHHRDIADLALFPTHAGSGWSVYLGDDRDVDRLAGTEHRVELAPRRHGRLLLGLPRRIHAPEMAAGRQRMRIHAISPVVTRCDGGKSTRTVPTSQSIESTLANTLARRVGWPSDGVSVRIVEDHTQPETVHLPKLGYVRGWIGSVDVEASPEAAHLLRVAQEVSMGGRVGYGFGRIIIEQAA